MLSPVVRRRLKKTLLWMEIFFILILGAGMGVVLGAYFQIRKMMPPDQAIDNYRAPVGTRILSSDGVLLGMIAAENREPVPLDQIPKVMQNAMVAIEDIRFYQHGGLDFYGVLRAIRANVLERDAAQGASTITQQLARNMFLSPRKTLSRKLKEMLLAVRIERNWTKQQILDAYLNQVYFGSGAYGIKAAAHTYYGKELSKLTLDEAAMLAGLPQRPTEFSPYECFHRNHDFGETKNRRNMVLDRMVALGAITVAQAAKAKKVPIRVAKQKPRTTGFFRAKYACQYVLDQLRDKYGYDQDSIDKGGLTVITTINWKMQKLAERVCREELDKIRHSHHVSETSLICIDPFTGYIRTMVGGVNQPWEKYQFNCATQAKRQTGSSFKLFVYATAFEAGRTPNTYVSNTARGVRLLDGTWYAPKNHEKGVPGGYPYTMAFARSINGAAFNVCQDMTPRKVAEMAKRFGISEHVPAYPSIALGVIEIPPIEMASAYGVIPAHGKLAEPIAVLEVRGENGEILEQAKPNLRDIGLKPETIQDLDVLTRAVVTSGTGTFANVVPDAHGKTGTTEDFTDAWFLGYTPDLVTAVWAGNRDNKPMARVFGATIACPIWTRFMQQAIQINPGKTGHPQPAPLPLTAQQPDWKRRHRHDAAGTDAANATDAHGMVRAIVCTETGMLATSRCPSTETRMFMPGELPGRCTVHRGRSLNPHLPRARSHRKKAPDATPDDATAAAATVTPPDPAPDPGEAKPDTN